MCLKRSGVIANVIAMASLRRKNGSKYWFACFTLPDGRQAQRSTKQTDRKRARKVAEAYERATHDKMSEAQIRRVMSDLFEQVSGQRLASSTVRGYSDRFLALKERESSKATFLRYRQLLGQFVTQLGDRADLDINFVTMADVARFRDGYASRLSPATANIALKMLRAFLQSAWRAGLVTENVGAKVEIVKPAQDIVKRRAFTIHELRRILDAAGQSEWRGLILFGIYSGARLGDIAILTWANLHELESKSPELRFKTRKTGRQQIVPLASPLVKYLLEIPSSDDPNTPLFPRAHRVVSGQERAGTLSNGFHEIMEAAGLAGGRSRKNTGKGRSNRRQTSALSFHSLRHTTTSLLKSAGISASVAMDIVGHDTPAISQHYTHLEDDVKRAALAKLPDLTIP
jgi:integrase